MYDYPSCHCPIHSNLRTQSQNYNRNNQVITTMKQITKTETSSNEFPQKNIRVYSNSSSRNNDNLRNSRITRKTVYGEKYDYGEKIKEKRNYILYASGTVREKKEIEQIEQIEQPQPQPTILEEHEIIDNYKYHESKNIKHQNPNRLSFTRHKRLSEPFEKTTYTQVNNDYPYQSYQSYNKKSQMRLKSVPNNNRVSYDTYTPSYYNKNYRNFSNENYRYENKNNYEDVTKTEIIRKKYNKGRRDLGFYETNVDECYEYIPPETENVEIIEKNVYKKNYPEIFNQQKGQTYTETKQDGDYMVKVTTTKSNLINDYNNLNNTWENKRNNYGGNYNYYQAENVRRTEKINKPVNFDLREKNVRSVSYNKNLRNVGYGNNGRNEYRKYEKIVRSGGTCACGKEHYGDNVCRQKYETEEEIYCPIHGRQTIRREYDY